MLAVASLALTGLLPAAQAADGTWTNLASGGLWSAPANWLNGTVADGSGSTARFNTLDLTSDIAVHLDSSRTLTGLVFGDTATGTAGGWFLDDNATGGGNQLTLAGPTPAITVNALGTGKTAVMGAVLAGSDGLTKSGVGTLSLTNVNSFTGGLTLNYGTLLEDFAAASTDLVNNANVLTLDGGTLSLKGASGATDSQTFASTTLNANRGAVVTLTGNSAASLTVALNGITRNPGSTLSFSTIPNTATLLATTTTGNEGSGILGPWASVGATTSLQYAANNGSGSIISYAGATTTTQPANLSDVNNAAANYAYGATASPTLTGPLTANTLRFTGAAGTLANGGNTITLNGLMNAGSGTLTLSGTGNLTIGANQELVILGNDKGTTINSRIVDNGAGTSSLVYSGAGSTLTINSNANTYSGGTVINSGTVTTAATGNATDTYLGAGPVTVNSGATLALNRTYLANNLTLNNATVTSGNGFASTLPAYYTITLNGLSTFSVSGGLSIAANMTGSGGFIKTSSTVGLPVTGNNSYTGPTTISQGGLSFMPQALYGGNSSFWTPATITVASGAVLGLYFSDSGMLNGYPDFSSAQVGTLLGNLTTGIYNNGLRAGSIIAFDASHGSGTYSSDIADSTGTGGGSIGVYKIGGNALTLSGNNTFSGPVTIGPSGTSGGTLKVYSLNYVTSGTLSPNTSSSLGHPTTAANGVITCGNQGNNQPVGLTYLGTGETTDRVLSMNAGVNGTALTLDQSGTGLLKFTSGINTPSGGNNRTLVLQGSTTGTGELAGSITNVNASQYVSVTKSGTGTWTLSGANTYQPVAGAGGLTTISGGCLVLGSANALPGGIGVSGGISPLTFNGGVLGLGAGDFTRSLAAAGTATGANFTGNGGWAAYGTNRAVNLGGASATITWATAGTGFNAKTLILGNATATHTLDFQNPIDLGTATRTVQVDNGAAIIDAKLSGTLTGSTGGNLTKTGNGTLALTGTNTYVGNTTVSAGCLLINGTNSGLGLITVNSGATNGGTGSIAGAVTYSSGANALFTVTPDPVSSTTNLTPLTIAGAMTYNANQVYLNVPTNLAAGTYTLAASSTAATANGSFPDPILLTGSYAPGVSGATVGLDAGGTNLILTVTGLPANPTKLAIISVNGGTNPTAQVSFPVVVQAQDDNGTPRLVVTDTAVQLSRKAGNYLLSGTLSGTIPAGSSTVTINGVRYANADTSVVLTAARTSGDSLASGDSAPFNVLPSTLPSYLTVTGFPSPQTAGVAGSVTVTCKTLSGTTATSYAGTVHFSSTAVSAGLPADYTFVPATDNGVHTFTGVTLQTAGTQTITATDTVTSSITGSQTNIVINPAAASTLAVSGFPTPQATNVAGSVRVTAQDAYANTATSYAGTIHFTSSDSLAVLPGNYTFVTGDAGSHTFTNGVSFQTLGTNQWIAATDTGTPALTGTQANITIWIFPTLFTWTNTAGGSWSAAANWTNDQGVVFAPLTAGEADYNLSFGAGTYTATHDLTDGFLLNRLNFAGAVTLNSPMGSPRSLTFTNNGSTLPVISQNSNGAVLVLNPLNLGTNLTIGGAGSGGVSLYGLVSGAGGLIKTNPSQLTIGIANTYSGGTTVNAGTVACSGPLSNPLGSGLATLNNGARFDLNASTCANPFALYGGTLANGNGFSANVNGPVYLGTNSTMDLATSGNMKIAGNISGPGGLIKIGVGGGPLILSGTNSYTGTNYVNVGSVRFDSTNAVANAVLNIAAGATVNLNYAYGEDRGIPALILDGVAQALGTYGSSASAAASMGGVVDDVHFSGRGTVTVTGVAPAQPPVAAFTATPTTGVRPLAVTFTNLSTVTGGAITNSFWDFGDGTVTSTPSTEVVVHTYTTAGTKTVTLIVTSPDGAGTNMQTGLIVVLPPNPPRVLTTRVVGSNVVLSGTGGPTNGVSYYYVLSSTNVALPMSAWTTNAQTGVFDAAGNFTYTNALTPGMPKQFFRLQMP